ncbi:MAG: hypothetical protein JWQ90_2095 [Hydrocarboniphaga sp.]|uniref:Ig-like domain-containing protein n=1 Tax=Hydrocarboniphaga sp. TaxID=2033016 RepID=UPI002616FDF3|nr:Ig-like domain-containing protein [Hydrocarboniphaga sp.]MDB5969645.1 hypothetical protein [Hydrocarboniphaga sp.]
MKTLRLLAALCTLVIGGCGSGSIQSPDFTSELTGISVTPATSTTFIGEVAEFTAIGSFTTPPGSSSPTSQSELDDVSWSVGDAAIATVDNDGKVTGVSAGSTTVTASSKDFHGTATVTVTPPELLSITITPPAATVGTGQTVTLTAEGSYRNSPDAAPTTGPVAVSWTSSDPAVATIDGAGVVSGISPGTTTITATQVGASGTPKTATAVVTVTFTPVLISIAVTPDPASSPLGSPIQFTATGTFTTAPGSPDPTSTGPATGVVWSIAPPTPPATTANAVIDSMTGIATGTAVGTATVVATSGAITDSAQLTITAPQLKALVISEDPPASPPVAAADKTIPLGTTQNYRALGIYTDSDVPRTLNSTDSVSWTTSNAAVATVDPTDAAGTTATAAGRGDATLTATSGAFSDTVKLTVSEATLTTLVRVEPTVGRVVPGASIEFTAIGRFSDGSETALADDKVTWTSADTAIATIDAQGFATGIVEGQVVITATLNPGSGGTGSATATLIVTDPVCTTPLLLDEGARTATDTSGICLLCGVDSPDNAIDNLSTNYATINVPVGLIGAGEALSVVGSSSTPNYTLPFPGGQVAGFVIGRPTGSLVLAELFSQLTVSTLLNGAVQESSGTVTPLRLDLLGIELVPNSDTALVSILTNLPYDSIRLQLNSGVATALSNVQVFSACATATPPPPTSALVGIDHVEPALASVQIGGTSEFQAIGRYADGTTGPLADSDVTWSSGTPSVATVDVNGRATGVAAGEAEIIATVKGPVGVGGQLSMSAVLTVAPLACTTPLLASDGATVTHAIGGLCLFCNVSDDANVIDAQGTTFATMAVPVAVLGAEASVTVSAVTNPAYAVPFPGANVPGFVIGRPAGSLVLTELLSQIEVSTLKQGVVQQTTGTTIPLRLDLLGLELTTNSDTALASIAATVPYDALRLTFHSGLASLLTSVQVYSACAATNVPD